MNVTTQKDQRAVFANAAAHLASGGCFVVEVIVSQLRRVPPGEVGRVFTLDPDHADAETSEDLVGQIAWSHHWIGVDGRLVRQSARPGRLRGRVDPAGRAEIVGRWVQGRPSSTRLNGVSVARWNVLNPASWATSRSLDSPACAPRAAPTSWDSDAGVQTSVETE